MRVIRAARTTDREDLVRMRVALWPDSQEGEVDGLLAMPPTEGAVLVAEAEGTGLDGFAEVGVRTFADGCASSPVAYLEGIWVDASARRSGIAAALVGEAETWARSAGLVELASDCEVDNVASQAFHRAVGFEEVQRSVCFRRDLTVRGPGSGRRPA